MKSTTIRLLAALLGLAVSACGIITLPQPGKPKEETKPAVEGPTLVGRIASVPSDKRFVLIQSYGKWEIEAGQVLTTRGPESRTANLKTSGEKLGEFAAADIQSGDVELGDAVYSPHVPKPVPPPQSAETQQPQGESASENVQKNN
jgi:hypothetical protein